MLYCERCQMLSEDGETCSLCGSRKLRPVSANDPVFLFTTGQEEAERIAAAFDDEKLPHMERILENGSASPALLGQNRFASTRIFVPFAEMEHARDVMRGIGALKDGGEEDGPAVSGAGAHTAPREAARGKEEKPMSSGRRAALRIVSIILFLLLVCLVVFGSDAIVAVIKSIFR